MTIKRRPVPRDRNDSRPKRQAISRQKTAQFFSVNGARYVALPPSKNASQYFTVINIESKTYVTEEWLRKKLTSYRSDDDVFCDEFLTGVLFTGTPAEESRIIISPEARHYMKSIGTIYKIDPAAPSPGPYLVSAGQLLEIYRLYDDTQGAFVTSILLSNDLQAQPEEPKPVCSPNLGRHYYPKSGGEMPQTGVVAVPSRLRDLPTNTTAFAGLRVAVKDNFAIQGVKTSLCNRAFCELYPPAKETAACIQLLRQRGAVIVGTTKLASFAATEEPLECVDYQAPWNPRADGHQSPAGSSSGSGAAIASYPWLDIAIGSDTSGSGRRPGHWNGCLAMRPSHGVLPVDGYTASFRQFDVPTFFGRDVAKCKAFASEWYGDLLPEVKILPPRIIYPLDYMFLISNKDQLQLIDQFVIDLEVVMGIKQEKVTLTSLWDSSPPAEAGGQSLDEYMKHACRDSFFHDDYHNFGCFRQEYQNKFSKTPYVSPPIRWQWDLATKITQSARDTAVKKLAVYRTWFCNIVMREQEHNSIVILPIENMSPRYRDEARTHFDPIGVPMLFLSPIIRGPEFTVPIGQVPFESRALRRAYQRDHNFRRLLQALAGVILFGTPHSTSDNVESWDSPALLVQIGLISKKKRSLDPSDIEKFARFSREFEQASVLAPILSVYETQSTKVKSPRWFVKKAPANIGSEPKSARQTDPLTNEATMGSSEDGFEMVRQFTDIPSGRQGSLLPCHIIPVVRNERFFGRDARLQEIYSVFFESSESCEHEEENKTVKTFAICGPGGMGKTQIATEFVHRHKKCFDAIFWIYADTAGKITESFTRIALELGLVAADSIDSRDPVVTRDLVKGWLANPMKTADPADVLETGQASWLIVFDNADNPDQLEDFWPLDGPGCVLFTSRVPLARHTNYLALNGIQLEPFDAVEGSSFLSELTKKAEDSSDVVRILGGLPLAMTQMAGIILDYEYSFKEFVKTYSEEESRKELMQLRLDQPRNRSGYEHTLASVWALESLDHSRALLEVLSFLDPDSIQEGILKTNLHAVAVDGFPKTMVAYHRARTELLQRSLITRNDEKLQVHRLVQDAARTKMDQQRIKVIFSGTVALVSSIWPFQEFDWRHGVGRWRLCEQLLPHVLSLEQHWSRLQLSCETYEEDFPFAKLLTDAGCNQAINDLKALLAEIHHNLGCIGTETNNPAETLHHFKIFNELMIDEIADPAQGNDKRLAISWNELGNAYMLNGQWDKGEGSFRKSIAAMRQVHGFRNVDNSFALVNLGLTFWLTDRLEEAVEVLMEGLKYREALHGPDDKESFMYGSPSTNDVFLSLTA
ncbi:MAG: hypothetical protein Q9193_000116 [Seirophora villosa]